MTMASSVFGAEVDNFNSKLVDIPDREAQVDQLANQYLAHAVEASHQVEGCNEEVLYQALRLAFKDRSKGMFVQDLLKQVHFPVRYMQKGESIYKDWKLRNGVILAAKISRVDKLSLSPVIRVGPRDIGVDKFQHMFGSGFNYFQSHYLEGKSIHRVLNVGIRNEKTFLGGNVLATGVYSYADLSANFNGMRFWNHVLLRNDDILGTEYNRGPYVQCVNNQWVVNKENPIKLASYIDESFDESINCSKFATKNSLEKIQAEVSASKFSGLVKCADNVDILNKLERKYRSHDIYKYILNMDGHTKVD